MQGKGARQVRISIVRIHLRGCETNVQTYGQTKNSERQEKAVRYVSRQKFKMFKMEMKEKSRCH